MNKAKSVKADQGAIYVDYNNIDHCWGHYGTHSGYCYATFSDESDAELYLSRTIEENT